MLKYYICGLLLLTACSPTITGSGITDERTDSCVAGYVEDTPGKGTLDILFPTEFAPDVTSIKDVSIEVAQKVTEQLGTC